MSFNWRQTSCNLKPFELWTNQNKSKKMKHSKKKRKIWLKKWCLKYSLKKNKKLKKNETWGKEKNKMYHYLQHDGLWRRFVVQFSTPTSPTRRLLGATKTLWCVLERLRAFANHVLTCAIVKPVTRANCCFSRTVGYGSLSCLKYHDFSFEVASFGNELVLRTPLAHMVRGGGFRFRTRNLESGESDFFCRISSSM